MTLYELINQVAEIVLPGSRLDEYILNTSDDNGGFLRTCYCRKGKPVNDRSVGDLKTVLLTAKQKIEPEQLKDREYTRAKLQLTYGNDYTNPEDLEWDRELGYCWCYIVDLEEKAYSILKEEPIY